MRGIQRNGGSESEEGQTDGGIECHGPCMSVLIFVVMFTDSWMNATCPCEAPSPFFAQSRHHPPLISVKKPPPVDGAPTELNR